MQFLENLKPLKIYKKPMFLPTVDGDKKKKSAIFLLTPNYESSKATMTSDLFINRLRFASYYIEKDLTYFISSKVMNKVDDVTETYIRDFSQYDMYQSLCEMKAAERNALKDSTFGLPKKRKYPLNDESHVRSAIKFFNYVDKDDEAELARNIKKAIKKFGMKVNVGDKNRFSKYYKPVTESADIAIYEGKVVDLGNDNYSYRFYDGDNEVCEVCIRYKEDNNYIYELHVNPQYQKQGIGSSLIEYATDILGGDNLAVDKNNKVALHMYEDAGFEITGTNKQDQYIMSLIEDKLHAKERNALKDSTFGVPSKRKFPLNDESHVRSAIRFFNKVDPEDEATLARNIKKAIKKFGMKVSVGSNNRFSKYYTSPATEAALMEVSVSSNIDKDYKSKGKKNLNVYNKEIITKSMVEKYKELKHVRLENETCAFFDGDNLVGYVAVEDKGDYYTWITALEITKDYQGYGLGEQLLKYAIDNMNANALSVNKNNKVAYEMYKKAGFYVFDDTDTMYFMTTDPVKAELTETAIKEDDEESLEVEEIDHILDLNKELKSWDYGIKKNGKVLNLSGREFAKEYRLQSPAEFEKTKTGVCWDFCLYQSNKMREWGIPYVNYYIELPDTPNSDTHTFTVATIDNKFIYMEASFGKTLGVYSAKKIDDIFNFVLSNMVSNYEGKYSYEIHKFTDYSKYGATTIQFMDDMLKQPLVKKGTITGGKVIDKGIVKESYIEENCSAIVPDDRITCTGYVNDIQRLKYFCDTSFYETILNSLGYCDIEVRDIPYIHLIEADYDKVEVDNRNGLYFIDIYINDNGFQSVDEYVTYVTACIIKGLIMSFYPKLPEVIAVDFANFLSNSLMSRNAENLVDDIIGDHNICDALADLQSKGITEEEWVDKRDNLYDKKLGEALVQEKKAMSAESLTNSLKYRGSTKNKVKLGRIRNTSKRLVDDIKDSMEIEGPKAPKLPTAPKAANTSPKNNDNSSEEGNGNEENSEEKITESMLQALSEENYIIYGDYVTFFNEDAANDTMLKRILWTERMVKRKEVVALLDRVKADCPFIKYTYTDLKRYQQRNLFVDLYYYNQAFFKNNTWKLRKAFNLYKDLLDRLINDKRIKQAGYTRRTVFIPVNDWHKNPSTRMWLFREDINPISIIYDLMVNDPNGLKKLFKGVGVVFFSKDVYFTVDMQNCTKRDAMKFKTFIQKINKGEEFDTEDVDTTEDTPSKEAIKTTIMDDIEDSKGVDLTKANDKVKKDKSTDKITTTVTPTVSTKKETPKRTNQSSRAKSTTTSTSTPKTASRSNSTAATRVKRAKKQAEEDVKQKDEEVKEVEKNMSKATANKPETDSKIKSDGELQKEIIRSIDADLIDNPDIQDVDTAYDAMDSDEDLKDLLVGLDSMKDDTVNISQARAERMSELDRELLDKSVKGRTIKEIIKPAEDPTKPVPLPETSLPVASPNPEWKDMTYMNFDKTYDLEKDIINSFEHFTTTTRPMAIRNITAVDNSTSEDYIDVYTCEYEDYRGKRYTIKLDIPKVKNERFILRGNTRMLQTQFFNMPIVKTADDVCQIVTNYKKIIISRYNTATGKSLPITSRLIKAADKYTGRRIKFYPGDNTLICAKYNLPIDYIDLSAVFSKIETDTWTIYFNQDELRKEYEVDDKLGTPYAVSKDKQTLKYYSNSDTRPFIYELLNMIELEKDGKLDSEFIDLIDSIAPTSKGTYTRAKIMGSEIPLVVVCAYHDGLTNVLKKANIRYQLKDKLTPEERHGAEFDYIRFKDGYLVFESDYNSSLLLNGLKDCDCNLYSMMDIDDKNMYLDFLDNFGGRIKADGLDNFYDCEIDPISKETLAYYKLPTEYISVLLYANRLLSDNKFVKHTDTSSRRARRFELIAAYTYQVLADAYSEYSTSVKHNRNGATFSCKQSAVIDKILADPTSSDYSTINMLNDIESTNAITTKGLSGLNADRSYSLDKRTYDDSMLDVVGMSTGFSANVGITRQATMDMNIEGERGYVKDIHGNTKDMNTAKTLTATEAVVPLSTTHDDPFRVAMTFIQSSKHAVRTDHSDPLLVTNGADEALPYLCSDQFAHKAKQDGTITELTDEDMIIEYKDGSKEYIDLKETIQKNSDGGFYVPLKLDADEKLKVGSKVKPNQILAYDKTSLSNSAGEDDNLAYDVGTLAKVAIINMDEGFEDSGIVTEGLAKKLTARIIYMEDCILDKSTNIYNLAKVGQHVEQGDSLLVWQTPYDEEEVNALLKALADDREAVSELGRHTVQSEVTGTLVGIKMYRTVELDELSDSLKKALRDYEKPIGELKKKLKEENIDTSTLPANYPLKPTGKLKKAGDGVLIEFYVEYDDIVGVGDKITYNAANKAVIKSVIPEGKEPYTDFRPNEPISALVSSTSIAKRMVTSTRVYGYLQKLMIELDRSCKDMAGIPYDDSTV